MCEWTRAIATILLGLVAVGACVTSPAADRIKPGAELRDCDDCPHMVVLPAGNFMMGSPQSEVGRLAHEGPLHGVTIAHPFAVSKFEITVGQYAEFIARSGHVSGNKCTVWTGVRPGETLAGKNWQDPNFTQTPNDPVVCVTWNDAQAFVRWLTEKTGARYRLLSEAEWEYAARAGTTTRYSFGDDETFICNFANVPDQSAKAAIGENVWKYADCDDGFGFATAPVGTFRPNAFGLYDMHGNVWEWTEDCYVANFDGAPRDGSAWITAPCKSRVVKGASLSAPIQHARSASRYRGVIEIPNSSEADASFYHNFNLGFRIARDISN